MTQARWSEEGALALSEVSAPYPVSRVSFEQHPWNTSNAPQCYAPNESDGLSLPPLALPPLALPPPSLPSPSVSDFATQLYTISHLIFFSILGTLSRLGLEALTFYPGAPVVTGVLWANVGGCIVMGFLLEDKNLFLEEWGLDMGTMPSQELKTSTEWARKHKSVKKTIPLYIGLTTGFCGSFTSFSSFMRDVFLALSNDLPNPSEGSSHNPASISRNDGDSFMAAVAVLAVTISLSMSALFFGAHLALACDSWMPSLPFRLIRKVVDRAVVFLAWGCWLGAILLAIWPPDRSDDASTQEKWRGRALFAVIFGPLGCLLRFYASLSLNARIETFPLGTFTVNIFGTVIEGICYDLQHVPGIGAISSTNTPPSPSLQTSCQILQGVMDGFCGCTTTVSTWVVELHGLSSRRHAYLYGVLSVAVAWAFLVIIMGGLRWTRGFASPVCS